MRKHPALTLIEVLVTLGILAIVSVPTILSIGNIRAKHTLSANADILSNALKQARIYARENKDGAEWGVRYLNSSSFALVAKDETGTRTIAQYGLEAPSTFDSTNFNIWFVQGTGNLKDGVSQSIIVKSVASQTYFRKVDVSVNGVIEVK